jgi:hypothetical protein
MRVYRSCRGMDYQWGCRLVDWRSRFGESTVGLNFIELSGDTRDVDEDEVEAAHVLLSTPEKV